MIAKIKQILASFILDTHAHIEPTTDLSDKVIVVTGASKGLGKTVAKTLLANNAKVVVIATSVQNLQKSFATDTSNNLLLLAGDVSNPADVARCIKETVRTFGTIDVLINNAGVFGDSLIETVTEHDIDRMIATNMKGVVLMTSQVVPVMKKQKNGTIINIGSKISHNTQVGPGKSLYAMTKYAVEGFSFALNRELKKSGIRVCCVMPGTLQTFVSLQTKNYLSPHRIAQLILFMIRFDDVDFESIVIKSKNQEI